MPTERNDLCHGRTFVAHISQGGGAKIVKCEAAFKSSAAAYLPKGPSKFVLVLVPLCGTVGYDPETGLPREAFFSARAKSGTLLDGLLYDAGVLLSLALQYGTPATALAKSVACLEDGSPASPVGELIDVIVKEVEAANQSNSQGVTDADVQAEEGQAKERARELFEG